MGYPIPWRSTYHYPGPVLGYPGVRPAGGIVFGIELGNYMTWTGQSFVQRFWQSRERPWVSAL